MHNIVNRNKNIIENKKIMLDVMVTKWKVTNFEYGSTG